jgi:hypothetical protein
MLPPPPSRNIPTRNAAILAVRKMKENMEQVKYWESKEMKEDNLKKKSVLQHRIQKNVGNNYSESNSTKRKRLKILDDVEKYVQKMSDHSLNSNTGILDSMTTEACVDNHIPSNLEKSIQEMEMPLSVTKRREKDAKAIARKQHSNQRMFLSRRLSRNIESSNLNDSPNFSPITATTLLFSPEANPSSMNANTIRH